MAPVFLPTRPAVLLSKNKLVVYDLDRLVVMDLVHKSARSIYIPSPVNSIQAANPAIKIDAKAQIYFKHGGRIYRMNENGELKLLWENNIAPELYITAFFIDRSDVLWVSVNAQGLIKVDLRALPFQSFTYQTNFAIDILQKAGISPSQIPKKWSAIYSPYYFRQARDDSGRLYLSCNYYTDNSVYRVNGTGLQPYRISRSSTTYSALLHSQKEGIQVFDEGAATWYSLHGKGLKPNILPYEKNSV